VSPPGRQALEFVEKYEAGAGRRRLLEDIANIGFAGANVLREQLRALEEKTGFFKTQRKCSARWTSVNQFEMLKKICL
jgi:hypothetical protein